MILITRQLGSSNGGKSPPDYRNQGKLVSTYFKFSFNCLFFIRLVPFSFFSHMLNRNPIYPRQMVTAITVPATLGLLFHFILSSGLPKNSFLFKVCASKLKRIAD